MLRSDMKISGPVGLGGLVSTAFSSARVKLGFMTTNECLQPTRLPSAVSCGSWCCSLLAVPSVQSFVVRRAAEAKR
jgi:hypothetical protein